MKKFLFISASILLTAVACNPQEGEEPVGSPIYFDAFGFKAEANDVISNDIIVTSPAVGQLEIELPVGTDPKALESLVPYFEVEEGATVTVDGQTVESGVTQIDFSEVADFYITKENRNALYSIEVTVRTAPSWRLLAKSLDTLKSDFTVALNSEGVLYVAGVIDKDKTADSKYEIPMLYRIEGGQFVNAVTSGSVTDTTANYISMNFDQNDVPYVLFRDYKGGGMTVAKIENGAVTIIGERSAIDVSNTQGAVLPVSDNEIYVAEYDNKSGTMRRALNLARYDGSQWTNGLTLPNRSNKLTARIVKVTGKTVNGVHYIFAVDYTSYTADVYKYDLSSKKGWEVVASPLVIPARADGTQLGFSNIYTPAVFNVDDYDNIYYITGSQFIGDSFNPGVIRYNQETKEQQLIGSAFSNISNDKYANFSIAFDDAGTPFIAYKYGNMNATTYVSYQDNATKQWSTPIAVNTSGSEPQICFDENGVGYISVLNEDDLLEIYTTAD